MLNCKNVLLASLLTTLPIGRIAADGDHTASLGAAYTPQQTTFSIWSPDTDDVKLSLQGATGLLAMRRQPDTDEYSDVYTVTVPGDKHLATYNYAIGGKAVRDPYGVMIDPATGLNVVVDLSRTDPNGGWAAPPLLLRREDAVIYEVNVHDFT